MGKYTPLTDWLRKQPGKNVTLSFDQIEQIIGDSLPPNAREYLRGWDNTSGSAINDSFLDAGWKTAMVDIENEKVKFQRREVREV
jgi:hypothetical protein